MPLFLVLALLAFPVASEAEPIRFRDASAEKRAVAVQAMARQAATGWERTRLASEAFLGIPYVVSPLGEGEGIDRDPRFRLDGVDCLTLVETALALGNADSAEAALVALDDIRYAAGTMPAFENRLHLMIAQWIPDLIAKGYLEEATARFGETVAAEIRYDRQRWERRPASLRPLAWRPGLEGSFSIPMIPLERAMEIAPTLPEGLVINVVRAARPDRLNRVTHTGFVVIRDGKRYVRHASWGRREVVDEPIERFLGRHAQMRKWKVDGIHLLAVRDNAERVRGLLGARVVEAADR